LGPLKIPWRRKDSSDPSNRLRAGPSNRLRAGPSTRLRAGDPYWDFFINRPPADLANSITELIRSAPEGNVFPTKAELHTPEITSSHVKELARYLGADLVGIARLNDNSPLPPAGADEGGAEQYPFAVVCAVPAEYDPREAPGIGGQVPVQNGLFITFVLSAWIRELGFRATALADPNGEKLAAAAGLGTLGPDGRLVTPKYGTRVHVTDVIRTDLPLAPDR
jgi:hypothetical protein